jgi:hypothetical protein
MKPHQLDVYLRGDELFVVPSLPSREGMRALDTVVVVEGGWEGLAAALSQGEQLALNAAQQPASRRRFGKLEKLLKATGCRTFTELVRYAKMCSIARLPEYVLVDESVPGKYGNSFEGVGQQELPAESSIEELARIARRMLEGAKRT